MYKLKKIIGLEYPLKRWIFSFISALIFYATLFFVERSLNMGLILEVLISSTLAGIIYLILVYLLGLIRLEEIKKYVKF